MAQQKKRIFWIGFARVCAKSLFCQGFTAKRNDAQKTQSMHYGSCSALLLLQKADRQPPLHEKGAAARISGVVRRLRPFCHRCPGASGRTPQKCTTPAKHGAQYPRAVDLPRCEIKIDATTKTPKTTRFSVFYFAFRAVFRTFRAISRVQHIMKNFGCHLMILPVWEDLNHHP